MHVNNDVKTTYICLIHNDDDGTQKKGEKFLVELLISFNVPHIFTCLGDANIMLVEVEQGDNREGG